MMTSYNQPSELAKQCFKENRDLFGNNQTQPEKFNLYNGLRALAEAVQQMEQEINALRQEVYQLKLKQ